MCSSLGFTPGVVCWGGPAVRSAGCGEQRHGEGGWVPRAEGGRPLLLGRNLEKLEWGQKGGEREASAGRPELCQVPKTGKGRGCGWTYY